MRFLQGPWRKACGQVGVLWPLRSDSVRIAECLLSLSLIEAGRGKLPSWQLEIPVAGFSCPRCHLPAPFLTLLEVVVTLGGMGLWEETSWQDFVSQTEHFDMFLVTLVPF